MEPTDAMGDTIGAAAARRLAAAAWADLRDLLDLQLSPLGLRAMAALAPVPGEVVLDVGCGTGQSVAQLAGLVGPAGRVIGVDVSSLLLEVARERTRGLGQVRMVEADAQGLDLAAGSVDACFSRFGVMAFADPVAAFANFHRMLKPGGRLAFVCWRDLAENELDLLPLRAAGLEALADATPFSFGDADVVRATLGRAGFRAIEVEAHDQDVTCGDVAATAQVVLRVGPLGRILRERPGLLAAAEGPVRAALAARERAGGVALRAAVWVVRAVT